MRKPAQNAEGEKRDSRKHSPTVSFCSLGKICSSVHRPAACSTASRLLTCSIVLFVVMSWCSSWLFCALESMHLRQGTLETIPFDLVQCPSTFARRNQSNEKEISTELNISVKHGMYNLQQHMHAGYMLKRVLRPPGSFKLYGDKTVQRVGSVW